MSISYQPLVSIIIPTYNRADLIGETLDSVIAQTYQNWECIVVDDGSTDHTDAVVQSYINKDKRFKYYHRPIEHQPGGNGARNYGFKKSKGEYIQWFDSDDLMVKDKIEKKITGIQSQDYDFIISKSRYYNNLEKNTYTYNYKQEDVNFLSYATSSINWITNDMLLKREVAEKIKFNEELKAGQEYNFTCKLLLITNHLKKIDEYLTLRRYHLDSIGKKRQLDKKHYWYTNFNLHWHNYLELNENFNIPEKFKRYALLKCILSYLNCEEIKLPSKFYYHLLSVFKGKVIYFCLAVISKMITNRYQFFYNQLK